MNVRVTLVLVIAALAAGGYVLAIDRPRVEERRLEVRDSRRLLTFEPSNVESIELSLAEDAGRVRLVRTPESGSGWAIEEPLQEAADAITVEGLLSALDGMRVRFDEELPADPAERAAFGFEQQRAIVLALANGERFELVFGAEAPVGGLRYVSFSGRPNRVLGVPGTGFRPPAPELGRLRDGRLFRIAPRDVRAIEIEHREGTQIKIERTPEPLDQPAEDDFRFMGEAAWRLSAPVRAQAAIKAVSELLVELHSARATRILDPPLELSEFGLEPPLVEVRLRSEERETSIAFGSIGGRSYARLGADTRVLEIEPKLLEYLPEDLFAYRFKRVLSMRRPEVDELEIEFPRDGKRFRIVGVGEGWGVSTDSATTDSATRSGSPTESDAATEPDAASGDESQVPMLDTFRVEAALHVVDLLEAEGEIDVQPSEREERAAELGLAPPRVRIRFVSPGGKLRGELAIGDRVEGGAWAARSSGSDRIWILDPQIDDVFPVSVDAFDTSWRRSELGSKAGSSPLDPGEPGSGGGPPRSSAKSAL